MKKTLAKGGKTEKNMKKQSILNLVNSILLLCTLLFSVISFAWYSNITTITPDLSFGAHDISQLKGLQKGNYDDAQSTWEYKEAPSLGTALAQVPASVSYDTFEMGVIDDLGYLKDTNCVYYCLPISATNTNVIVNLSYVADTDGNRFTWKDEDLTSIIGDTLTTAAGYEGFDPSAEGGVHTYVIYDCALSTTAPAQMNHTAIHNLFEGKTEDPLSTANMVSAVGYDPESAITDNVTLTSTFGVDYYVYIRVYPNLSNYEELAMLMLDNMPFYLAFNLKLYIGLPGATN